MSDPTRTDNQEPAGKHSKARRRLLKSLVLGGGAATAATVIPTRWVKPVIDTIEVPLHAQASPGPGGTIVSTMACTLFVGDEEFSEGTHVASASLPTGDGFGDVSDGFSDTDGDSILDIDSISVTVDPTASGVPVHLDIVPITDPTNDATIGDGADFDGTAGDLARADQNATTDTAGLASFADAEYNSASDGTDSDATTGFTATFSATGYSNCVITVTFPLG